MNRFKLLTAVTLPLALCLFCAAQESSTSIGPADLWAAAKLGDVERARQVLDSGVDVDSRTPYGSTALIFAAEHGHLEVARLLLDRNADANATDTFYKGSAYTWASLGGHKEVAELIKECGGKASFDVGSAAAKPPPEITNVDPESAEASVNPEMLAADQHFVARNWPQFRGVGSRGIGDGHDLPLKWSVVDNENVAWKTPIPGLGHSCPVIWEELVFVTSSVSKSADMSIRTGHYGDYQSIPETEPHEFVLFALDRNSGSIRWQQTATVGIPKVKRHLKSTHANATCVTDGKFVVAMFGAEGIYCYDFDGQLIWKRDLGFLDSGWFYDADYQWGFASSPIIHGDRVIIQCDVQKDSYIAALNLADGSEVWRTLRDEIPGWSSPTVCDTAAGPIVVTNGTKRVRGYDALTGRQLWELSGNSEVVVPTPQFAYQTVYVTSGYRPIQPIYAISPDAVGDISLQGEELKNDSIKWSMRRHGPYLPTPLVYRGFLYTLDNLGVVSCYEALTGKRVYRERITGFGTLSFVASPIAANGHLFAIAEDGQVIVIKAGAKFEPLHANPTGEAVLSTPAIAHDMFFVRTQSHLVALKKMAPDSKPDESGDGK